MVGFCVGGNYWLTAVRRNVSSSGSVVADARRLAKGKGNMPPTLSGRLSPNKPKFVAQVRAVVSEGGVCDPSCLAVPTCNPPQRAGFGNEEGGDEEDLIPHLETPIPHPGTNRSPRNSRRPKTPEHGFELLNGNVGRWDEIV